MCDRVLNDQRFDALRMCQGHAKADRPAVVLHVKRVPRQIHRLGELIHHLGDVVEGVGELLGVGAVAVPEAGVVGSDQVELVGQPGEQRLEHSRRGGKSVEQQECRRVFGSGFAVEDREAVHFHTTVEVCRDISDSFGWASGLWENRTGASRRRTRRASRRGSRGPANPTASS